MASHSRKRSRHSRKRTHHDRHKDSHHRHRHHHHKKHKRHHQHHHHREGKGEGSDAALELDERTLRQALHSLDADVLSLGSSSDGDLMSFDEESSQAVARKTSEDGATEERSCHSPSLTVTTHELGQSRLVIASARDALSGNSAGEESVEESNERLVQPLPEEKDITIAITTASLPGEEPDHSTDSAHNRLKWSTLYKAARSGCAIAANPSENGSELNSGLDHKPDDAVEQASESPLRDKSYTGSPASVSSRCTKERKSRSRSRSHSLSRSRSRSRSDSPEKRRRGYGRYSKRETHGRNYRGHRSEFHDWDKKRQRSRSRIRSRSRARDRSHSRDRYHHSRHRNRSHSRDRTQSRSLGRNRSRSRDRHHYHRSGHRDWSRSRDRGLPHYGRDKIHYHGKYRNQYRNHRRDRHQYRDHYDSRGRTRSRRIESDRRRRRDGSSSSGSRSRSRSGDAHGRRRSRSYSRSKEGSRRDYSCESDGSTTDSSESTNGGGRDDAGADSSCHSNNSPKKHPVETAGPAPADPKQEKIAQLTEFCRQLADEKEEEDTAAIEQPVVHPFMVGQQPSLVYHNNSWKTPSQMVLESNTASVEGKGVVELYPVSSGLEHQREDQVLTTTGESLPVGQLVTQRLEAQNQFLLNPLDPQARAAFEYAENQMEQWCAGQHKPGQFTGQSTLKPLTKADHQQGVQAWARKNMFAGLAPVMSSFGIRMLKKMGWKEGTALGRAGIGRVDPIELSVKVDRQGLATEQDHRPPVVPATATPTVSGKSAPACLQGKHPVSALQELCTQKHWDPPLYELISCTGKSHKMTFLFQVTIPPGTFRPSFGSNSKKLAKARAAIACLTSLGLMPPSGEPL